MSWLRKGNFTALAVVLGLGALFTFFFLDGLLRWALVRAAQTAAGARVEIGSLKTGLLQGRLALGRVAVADRNAPMKNVLEFEVAELSFLPSAALRGKVVIPEAALTGLRFGTARSKSGALPRAKPSKLELLARQQLEPVQKALQAQAGELKALPKELDVKKLSSLKSLDDTKDRLKALPDRFKTQAELPKKIERELKDIQTSLQSLQGGGSPADIARKVQTVSQAQQRLKAMQAEVLQAKNDLSAQFDDVNAGLRKAQELKNKDLSGLLAEAGLPTLDADSLTKRLLGPAASQKVSNALYWLSWARKHAAEKKGSSQPKPEQRRRGVDVEFPRPGAYPEFLLEHAKLSGSLSGLAGGKDLDVEGELTGATSNPPLYGKPARLTLKGAVQGGPAFSLDGMLDQTKPKAQASVAFSASGLPMAGASLGDAELGAQVQAGMAKVSGQLRLDGESWKGEAQVTAEGVSLEPKLGLSGDMARYAGSALKSVKRFGVRVGVEGAEDDLHLSLRSDLGQVLASGLKGAFSAAFADQRKQLEGKLNALYADKAGPLKSQADGLQKQLQGPLDTQQGAIQDALKSAAAKSFGGSPVDKLKGLFR